MTCHRVCNKNNTTGTTCGVAIAYHYVTQKFTPVFSGVRVVRYFVVYIMFCRSLFVRFIFNTFHIYCLSFELWLLTTPLLSSNVFAHIFGKKKHFAFIIAINTSKLSFNLIVVNVDGLERREHVIAR